jgi:hypothetical protein
MNRRPQPLRASFRKLAAAMHRTTARRSDAVEVSLPQVGRKHALPHDLAHFTIERALGIEDGFWGSLASGALVGGARVTAGRQAPHAAELSAEILKRNRAALTEAEVAVALIYEASLHPSPVVRAPAVWRELAARYPRGRFARLTANDIARVIGVVSDTTRRWQAMREGETMTLEWLSATPARQSVTYG